MKQYITILLLLVGMAAHAQDSTIAEIRDSTRPHSAAHKAFLVRHRQIWREGHDTAEHWLATQPKWRDSMVVYDKIVARSDSAMQARANKFAHAQEQIDLQDQHCWELWKPYTDSLRLIGQQNHIVGDMHIHFYYKQY